MKKTVLVSCVVMALTAATGAKAAILFDFSTATGDLGTSHTYTVGPASTKLTAFGTPSADLFGKANGGDENGVGMTNDPSGDDEIYYGKGFLQIDASTLASVQLTFNSTTSGERWSIFGSNTSGVLGSLLTFGTTETTSIVLPKFNFYDVESTVAPGGDNGGNVLLKSMTAVSGVPEPATWAMMLVGFGGLGAALRRRRTTLALGAA